MRSLPLQTEHTDGEKMDKSNNKYQNKDSVCIICTPDKTAKSTFFYVQETGHLMPEDADKAISRQNVESFLIGAVISGRGEISAGDERAPLVQGDCFFIDCSTPYSYKSSETEPWEIMWVHFNGCTTKQYHDLYSVNSGMVFRPFCFDKAVTAISEIITLCSSSPIEADIMCSKHLMDILTLALTSNDNANQYDSGLRRKLAMVNSYIDDHFAEDLTLERLSSEFYISKYYLTREYKKIYGRTIFQHIINVRINQGKKLLRFTDRSIEEIAHMCGFNDQSYFARQFKKAEGLTCFSYRKKWRE